MTAMDAAIPSYIGHETRRGADCPPEAAVDCKRGIIEVLQVNVNNPSAAKGSVPGSVLTGTAARLERKYRQGDGDSDPSPSPSYRRRQRRMSRLNCRRNSPQFTSRRGATVAVYAERVAVGFPAYGCANPALSHGSNFSVIPLNRTMPPVRPVVG